MVRIGYLGIQGTYSDEAFRKFFNKDWEEKYQEEVEGRNFDKFQPIFEALKKEQIEYAVLPIENSSTGGIMDVYDLLRDYHCYIIGETFVEVRHCLLAKPETTLEDLEEIYSHPQGFEQSKEFLNDFTWKQIPYYNTALSARYVADSDNIHYGAIASKRAASIYGLKVLKEGINSSHLNKTRFVVISKEQEKGCQREDKVSIVFTTKHQSGALYAVIRYLAERELNMVKIESRPMKNHPFEYLFYIDFEGNLEDNNVIEAVEKMQKHCSYFKVLGNYKKGEQNG